MFYIGDLFSRTSEFCIRLVEAMSPRARLASVWAFRVLIVLGVVAAASVGPLGCGTDDGSDAATIDRYRAHYDLSANGDLHVDERLSVWLPEGKHGIIRTFDTDDSRRRGRSHPVDVESVTKNGQPESWEWDSDTLVGRTAKIGDAGVELSEGVYEYRIISSTTGALEPGANGKVLWWWDVVGDSWRMPINAARITVMLPAEPADAWCVIAEEGYCNVEIKDRVLSVNVDDLTAYTPVTLHVEFAPGVLPVPPGGKSWWEYIGLALVVAVVAGLLVRLLAARLTAERPPGLPVLFEPPENMSPAVGARILFERNSPNDLAATLFDLASRGALRFDRVGEALRVTLVGSPDAGYERKLLRRMELRDAGDEVVVRDTTRGRDLMRRAQTALRRHVDKQVRQHLPASDRGLYLKLGAQGVAGAYLITVVAMIFLGLDWLWWPLLISAAVLFALAAPMFDPAVRTYRSESGREVWTRVGGFARFLTTDSSTSRFEAAEHLDWYLRYLPWAVALGAADAWAERFTEQGLALPDVPWIEEGTLPDKELISSLDLLAVPSIIHVGSLFDSTLGGMDLGGGSGGGGFGLGGGGGGSW